MSNIISVIKKLPGIESLAPVSREDICKAEASLNLIFAQEYKEYLSVFGTIYSDVVAISGLGGKPYDDVIELTEKCRSVNAQIPRTFYVVEDVGVDGLVIWQDESGTIYQSTPFRTPDKICNTLSEYLEYVLKG